MTKKLKRKDAYTVEPTDNIDKIQYLSRIIMKDGKEHIFTLTEMQHISDMFDSWKAQSHWKPKTSRGNG